MAADKNILDFQVASPGLMAFLRLKGGVGPNQFGLQVDPVIDVTDFYGVESAVINVDTGAAAAISTGVTGAVGTAPRRYMGLSGSISIGAAAGTWLTLGVGVQDTLTNTVVLFAQSVTPIVGGVYRVGWSGRMTVPAGWAPRFVVNGNAGGADHVAVLQYSYQRLDGLP